MKSNWSGTCTTVVTQSVKLLYWYHPSSTNTDRFHWRKSTEIYLWAKLPGLCPILQPNFLNPQFQDHILYSIQLISQIVYGYVPHCRSASLLAHLGDQFLDTLVSVEELNVKQGLCECLKLHCLIYLSIGWVFNNMIIELLGLKTQRDVLTILPLSTKLSNQQISHK